MRKLLFALGAVSTLAIAVPAAAQGYDAIHQQFQRLENRIERGAERGMLTRNEVRGLRGEFRQLVRLDAHYRRDGLSRWEYVDLDRRIDSLSQRVRWERRDDDRRYDDRSYDDRGYDNRRNGHDDDHRGRGRGHERDDD